MRQGVNVSPFRPVGLSASVFLKMSGGPFWIWLEASPPPEEKVNKKFQRAGYGWMGPPPYRKKHRRVGDCPARLIIRYAYAEPFILIVLDGSAIDDP